MSAAETGQNCVPKLRRLCTSVHWFKCLMYVYLFTVLVVIKNKKLNTNIPHNINGTTILWETNISK